MFIKDSICDEEITRISQIYFLQILHLTTKMWVYFADDMFKYSPYLILHDYVQEIFLDEGYGRTNDGVGDGLGKFLVNYDIILTGFVMEEFYHRR